MHHCCAVGKSGGLVRVLKVLTLPHGLLFINYFMHSILNTFQGCKKDLFLANFLGTK